MTALTIRDALITVLTFDNPVATSFTQIPDGIAFEETPALVIPPPARVITPQTIGRTSATYEQDLDLEVEFLDAPVEGDSQIERLAEVEAWVEQAIANLLANPTGDLGSGKSWMHLRRLSVHIDPPLTDKGQVFFYARLMIGLRGPLIIT